jgi:hypothetical protein
MTHDELRNNWSDAIIALVMNEASAAAMDLSSEDEREAIVQALQDAIEGRDRILRDARVWD